MKRLKLALTVLLCIGLLSLTGQGQTPQPAEPDEVTLNNVVKPVVGETALSSLWMRKSTLVLKGYTEMGTISTDDGSIVRVLMLELKAVGSEEKADGIAVQVTRNNGKTVESLVDSDKLDALIQAIDAIRKMDKNSTTLNNFEARYRTDGGLDVANLEVQGTRVGEIRTAQIIPTLGQIITSRAYLRPARLEELKRLVSSAKDKLEQIRKEAKEKHY